LLTLSLGRFLASAGYHRLKDLRGLAMKSMVVCTVLFAALCSMAAAEPLYDRKLEQAAMDVIARKIGDIRSDMAADYRPQIAATREEQSVMAEGKAWRILPADGDGDSSSVGSIQTYAASPGETPSPATAGNEGQSGRKIPRVIKF
jgi:hypothetical protein